MSERFHIAGGRPPCAFRHLAGALAGATLALVAAGRSMAAPTPTRCTPIGTARVALTVESPPGRPLVGVKLRLDYPASVSIAGLADQPSVRERVQGPDGFLLGPNDTDEGYLIVALAGTKPFPAGPLVTVRFDRCEAMPAATVKDFACQVMEGADEASALVREGMRCSLELSEDTKGAQ